MKLEIEDQHYERKLGSYRPKFEGKPDDYYTLDCKDICSALSVCFGIVVFFFFFSVALFFWANNVSTSNLVLVWSIILVIFIPTFIVFAYLGSNNKMEIEEKLIKDALNRITEKKERTANRYEAKENLHLQQSVDAIRQHG